MPVSVGTMSKPDHATPSRNLHRSGIDLGGAARRMTETLRRPLPHIVALFVLYHVASMVMTAAPSARGTLKRSLWKDSTVQEEFASWATLLTNLGLDVDANQLEEQAWKFAKWWTAMHRKAIVPFLDYQRATGTGQSWRMFVAPHRYPTRLQIQIYRPDEGWVEVYRRGSSDHTWRRDQLDQLRVRSALFNYFWGRRPRDYKAFLQWLAELAAMDFPHATQIRFDTYKYETQSPKDVYEQRVLAGEVTSSHTISLDSLR